MPAKLARPPLALFGASPAFAEPLHVGRPNVGNRERLLARIDSILESRWFSNHGPHVQELEHRLAEFLGVRHCLAIVNGTVALDLAIRAAGLSGEVIVPSFTFIATVHALHLQGIQPVFCDIDPATHTLDPAEVERRITPRTSGILGVHLWGEPCRIDDLAGIARRRGLKLLFDASHAFGSATASGFIGSFGDAEIFSFHATKYFNTFEGGAIATNDSDLAKRVSLMRNFGFEGYDHVVCAGTNGKMSEIAAAMGLTGLDALDDFVAVNRANYAAYRKHLREMPQVRLFPVKESERRNYQYVVLEIDPSAGISRDALIEVLHAENILARRYFYPGCHRMEPYASLYPEADARLPHTSAVCSRVIVLPTGTAVSESAIESICAIIKTAIQHGAAIMQELRTAPPR